jgi:hypothetical protein
LGVGESWQAVIDSLSAGYRFLGRRVELIAVPILLDLWLWLGPQLSIAPLVEDFLRYYESATAGLEGIPDFGPVASPEDLLNASQASNLMDALVSRTLLHVPSLLATIGPVGGDNVYEISSAAMALGLFTLLGLLGLLIGVFYMNLLASRLPIGSGAKPASAGELLTVVLRQWLKVILFIVVLTLFLFASALPLSVGTALLTLVSPALGALLIFVFMGAVFVIMFYLYFVTVALVLDDLPLHVAVIRSFTVVRGNFLATLLFIVLTLIISAGISGILSQVSRTFSMGLAIAIPVNAYIGTGLALALFVFYRTRILRSAAAEDADDAGRSIGSA